MTPPTPPPPTDSIVEKTGVAFFSFIASQAPLAAMLKTGRDPFTFYQPAIYEGYLWFLLIPAVISVAAIYWVTTSHRAFLVLLIIFVISGIILLVIFRYFPTHSDLHFWNWILMELYDCDSICYRITRVSLLKKNWSLTA
jgi:hypothetical protein